MEYDDDCFDEQWISFYHLYDHITQLSLYKLEQGERSRTEPALRRQVLVRNILATHLPDNGVKQTQEGWLDACFDQLDDDELMHAEDQDVMDQDTNDKPGSAAPTEHGYLEPNNKTLVLAVPFDYLSCPGNTGTEQRASHDTKQQPLTLLELPW